MRRLVSRLGFGLGLGFALLSSLYSRTAEALPSLEVSTTLGGSAASEYLVRVANPDAREARGVIEMRRDGNDGSPVLSQAPFAVPAKSTRYFRVPGDKGARLSAFAVMEDTTVRAQERYGNDASAIIFDIPPSDDQRLHELRTHGSNAVISHAVYDETTKKPVLTRRAAVYDGASLVLVPSSVFLSLPAAEREALMTWVRSGGAMGVALTDESDRSHFVDGELGLGHVHILSFNPWTTGVAGEVTMQEKIIAIAENDRHLNHFYGDPGIDRPMAGLDPNDGYRGVLPVAGVLLILQALLTAFAFRRLATKRGMGPAYRFVAGSSVVSFAAVIGLGIYAKGGFAPRARELSFAHAASGESVAWVRRNRAYFSSTGRTIELSPRDPANILDARISRDGRDSRATIRVIDADANGDGNGSGNIVLGGVEVRPWQTTSVTEIGTTSLGGGVRVESTSDGNVIVKNQTGATLRKVVAARMDGTCVAFDDIPNGEERTPRAPHSCAEFGPSWSDIAPPVEPRTRYRSNIELSAELEEPPVTVDGFRVEKRTTLLRVTGGAS